MKQMSIYISEQLSASLKDKLLKIIDTDEVSDADIENFFKTLDRNKLRDSLKGAKDKTFFDKHGLTGIKFERNKTAIELFTNVFKKNLDALNDIIKNDGTVSINDMETTGNIFDYCKGFEKEASEILQITPNGSSNTGPGELLLKFIIKEANTPEVGDVGIGDKEMEVKAITKNEGSESGGHAAGQKGKIRNSWALNFILNKYAFNLPSDEDNADSTIYFKNKSTGFTQLFNAYHNSKVSANKFIEVLIDAVLYQYRFKDGNLNKTELFDKVDYKTLSESVKKYLKNTVLHDTITNPEDIFDVVGAIQLYLYSLIEDFDYLICIYIDKTDKSNMNGKYILFKDIKGNKSELADVSNTLSALTFEAIGDPTHNRSKTGKIKFRK